MNPDLTWHMQVLDKIRGHYIALVEREVMRPGLCWPLKLSKSVPKKLPNIVSLLELANMTTDECEMGGEIHKILSAVSAQPSTTRHVERGVKLGAFARKEGNRR